MNCIKCDSPANTTIRNKDVICENCLIKTINHKFRACIGKNKVLTKNENVLLCHSGGPGSTALIDLVCNGISLDNHKKLRISPLALHICESFRSELDTEFVNSLINQCIKYNIPLYIVHISEYIRTNTVLPAANSVPLENKEIHDYDKMLSSITPTAYNDFIKKIKRALMIRIAKKLSCNHIFTGETTTTLASNLLANIVTGSGSYIEHDVAFIDTRNEAIHILRPLKDITKEELTYYTRIKKLFPIKTNTTKHSLHSVIGQFVEDLQDHFPATISTVCKIADKISTQNKRIDKCFLCEGNLDNIDQQLSAYEATQISRLVSSKKCQNLKSNIEKFIMNSDNEDCTSETIIKNNLCYSCNNLPVNRKLLNINSK